MHCSSNSTLCFATFSSVPFRNTLKSLFSKSSSSRTTMTIVDSSSSPAPSPSIPSSSTIGISNLSFESTFTAHLPSDPDTRNEPRPVLNAAFSYVSPTDPTVDDVSNAWADAVAAGQVRVRPQGDPKLEKALAGWSPSCASLFNLNPNAYPLEGSEETKSIIDVLGGFVDSKSKNQQPSLWSGMKPYAMCYGGHQFGSWAGQLGDGRAISLGEYVNKKDNGSRWEIQLKGAGKTPYSRFADGRAVLRSSVREFLCSEAMHFLGIPTTRALSLVTTGTGIIRDMFYEGNPQMEPGAVVARVAPSFLRLGNFQLAAAREDLDLLKSITDYALQFHFPHLMDEKERYALFLREVAQRNASMVAKWQAIGFVHGVMNTDNFSILGLTIDYGPYGFLDEYDPDYTPNTTDMDGKRYKFESQPNVAHWNIMQFAKSMVPLCGEDAALKVVTDFSKMFKTEYTNVMRQKLGFNSWIEGNDDELLQQFHRCMKNSKADFTNTWRGLSTIQSQSSKKDFMEWGEKLDLFVDDTCKTDWLSWLHSYQQRIQRTDHDNFNDNTERVNVMHAANPVYILRNYLAQTAIDKAEKGDYSEIKNLYQLLTRPYQEQQGMEKYTEKPPQWSKRRGVCVNSCSS